jgi:DNA-binding LytR/AlgR family response regulator
MENVKTLIIENDAQTAEELTEIVTALGYYVADTVYSAEVALKSLVRHKVDLVLLGSYFGTRVNGVDLIQEIRRKYDIPYIFIFSHQDSSSKELGLINEHTGILSRPFRQKEIQNTLEVTLYNYAQKLSILENSLSPEVDKNDFWLKEYFFIKIKNQMIKIPFQEILWAEAYDNYTCLQTEKEKYLLHKSLKTVEDKLNPKGFVRVHRSYVVNLEKVTSIENEYLFIQKHKVPINRQQKAEIVEKYLKINQSLTV